MYLNSSYWKKNQTKIDDPEQQFDFKPHSSTNHAVYVLDETVRYYKRKKKQLYACAIDASKAFDKVNRELLMHILHGKIDDEIWIILRLYYKDSLAFVKNGQEISTIFNTSIGVKQGGPLSPKLFSIYINELVNRILEERELIANINGIKTGLILYADDVIFLTENIEKMRRALEICEVFGEEHEIKWNPKKTQIICFNKNRDFRESTM